MFPCAIKMSVQMLVLFFVLTFANGQDRQIVSKLNPGCEHCNPTWAPLIYIRAEGSNDTIHQIWDFTDHIPAVVFAVGSPNSTLAISWKSSIINSEYPATFVFSEPPSYSFAVAIDSIIEYNDLKDNGHYDPKCSNKTKWPLDHLSWRLVDSVLTDKEAKAILHGDIRRGGTFEIKLDLLPFKDYATDLPHLIHTANSTLIDLRLVNLTEHRSYNSSRFALHFIMVSTDPTTDTWNVAMRKSLDDEHTPGVFEIIEIKSPKSASAGRGGFMQFRPVAYNEPERGVSSSTNAYISNFNRTKLPRNGILSRFYHDISELKFQHLHEDHDDMIIQDMVVSFGLAGDGFYKQHNFTAWSFTLGYGTPPLEGFSVFVLIIISIGLGVPILLAISGIGYVLARRCKQRNPPTRFTNDE